MLVVREPAVSVLELSARTLLKINCPAKGSEIHAKLLAVKAITVTAESSARTFLRRSGPAPLNMEVYAKM